MIASLRITNGEMLRPEQGYPVRLVVRGWKATSGSNGCAASRSAISDGSHARRRRDTRISSKAARRANHFCDGREIGDHLTVAAGAGEAERIDVISGLAWSGRGKISGSMSHSTAAGTGARPGSTASFWKRHACVYYEFDWNGEELLLQSRAMDETGYVQPSKDALRKIRGVNSIYHNNGIQTWAIKPDGEVENVEVG